jgi:hypothetical protein
LSETWVNINELTRRDIPEDRILISTAVRTSDVAPSVSCHCM